MREGGGISDGRSEIVDWVEWIGVGGDCRVGREEVEATWPGTTVGTTRGKTRLGVVRETGKSENGVLVGLSEWLGESTSCCDDVNWEYTRFRQLGGSSTEGEPANTSGWPDCQAWEGARALEHQARRASSSAAEWVV